MQPNEIDDFIEAVVKRMHADAEEVALRLKTNTAILAEKLRVKEAIIATRVVEDHECRFDEPTIKAIQDLAKTFDPATTQALRDWRKMYNIGKITALGTAVTVIVGALLLALWQGIVTLGHAVIK